MKIIREWETEYGEVIDYSQGGVFYYHKRKPEHKIDLVVCPICGKFGQETLIGEAVSGWEHSIILEKTGRFETLSKCEKTRGELVEELKKTRIGHLRWELGLDR